MKTKAILILDDMEDGRLIRSNYVVTEQMSDEDKETVLALLKKYRKIELDAYLSRNIKEQLE